MADEKSITLADMIEALREGAPWQRHMGKAPDHIQYYLFNVAFIGALSEAQYAAEHPDWVEAIKADYAKLTEAQSTAKSLSDAAKLAENEAVLWVSHLSPEKRARLEKMLEAEVVAQADAPSPAPAAEPVKESAPAVEPEKKEEPAAEPESVAPAKLEKPAEAAA